jgi:hypothetical protein
MGRKKNRVLAKGKNAAAATSARKHRPQPATEAVQQPGSTSPAEQPWRRGVTIQDPASNTEGPVSGGKRVRAGSLAGSGGTATPVRSPMKPLDSAPAGTAGGSSTSATAASPHQSKSARRRANKKLKRAGSGSATPQTSPMKPPEKCASFWHENAHKSLGGEMSTLCKYITVGDTIHIRKMSCVLTRCALISIPTIVNCVCIDYTIGFNYATGFMTGMTNHHDLIGLMSKMSIEDQEALLEASVRYT